MPPPTTVAGKLVLEECLKLNKALNYRIGDFKALANLRKNIAETARLRSQVVATSQGLKQAKQTTKETAALYKDLNKRAKEIGATANQSKKLWDRFLSKIPGGNSLTKVAVAGGLIAALLQIAVVAVLQAIQQQLNNLNIENIDKLIQEIQPIATQSINNKIEIRGLQKREQQRIIELNDIKEDIHLSDVNARNLRKQINDITYEVRKGRENVESRITEVKKQANDALYEVRQGRKIVEDRITTVKSEIDNRINTINSKVSEIINTFTTGLQSKINAAIDPIKSILANNKTEIDSLKAKVNQPGQTIDKQLITKQAVDASLAAVGSKLGQINQESYGQNIRINSIASGLNALGGQLGNLSNRISFIEKNPVKVPPQKNYDADIAGLNNRLKEQEKVNASALPKLDQILGLIPLIPARAAGLINPNIPSRSDLENAAATGTCRTTQPGGCSRKMIDDAVGNVNQNTNNRTNNVLDAINTGANAALLQGQGEILNRLGDQLPGGIGGKLVRGFKWLHLDRALNVLTFTATVHNGFMLSNDIIQTLIGAFSNVLQYPFLKDDDDQTIDIGQLINSTVENFVKSIVGAENYQAITTAWAKANRIYQASVNILNAFQGLSSAILTGLEMTAGKVAKIGNALRKSGEVLESAYGWMNPQPKFNRVTQTLENLQNGASTIQMVTQAPLDIINATTELTTATTELTNAIKDDGTAANKGKEAPEPDNLKATESATKLASTALELADLDLDPDE